MLIRYTKYFIMSYIRIFILLTTYVFVKVPSSTELATKTLRSSVFANDLSRIA